MSDDNEFCLEVIITAYRIWGPIGKTFSNVPTLNCHGFTLSRFSSRCEIGNLFCHRPSHSSSRSREGTRAEEKQKLFLELSPRPGPDGPNASSRSQDQCLRQKIELFFCRDFSGEEFREKHYCPYNFVPINWLWSGFIFPGLEHL